MAIQNILIVEDSKTETMFWRICCGKTAMQSRAPRTPRAAMACLLQHRPDLILMDVVMPGQNGFQLTRTITRTPAFADIPIILCTSKSQETDRVWACAREPVATLPNPLNAADLLTKIKMLG